MRENMFLLISNALCQKWRKNMISVSKDGASNVHVQHQGAVTCLNEVCVDGFYRIWCGSHQLDLTVQTIVQMFKDSFVEKHNL
jgi:hypothetical protein